ncbi:MAG: L-threonylcarbamoyladenylate synthase [Dialister sp.]|nr:L-threonylcarbamoyladenylate synthase [Dialister sp.]
MITKRIDAGAASFAEEIPWLASVIRSGGLVAFPTETVYGLGGNALDREAARRIYAAKGRPSDNPLIVHVASMEDVPLYVKTIAPVQKKLMEQFWPGPLTIIFDKKEIIPDETSGGLPTVAMRCPANEATRQIIRVAGVPLAGPSANISGRPSPTTASAVLSDLDGKIQAVIDDGTCDVGLESTIVAIEDGTIVIYRPGGVTEEMLSAIGPVRIDRAILGAGDRPKAPGMKYRHYAPKAPLAIFTGNIEKVEKAILEEAKKEGRIGFFVSTETAEKLPARHPVFIWGRRDNQREFAHNLFSGLHYFDSLPVERIVGEGTNTTGLGLAIMNRLEKASGHHIVVKDA